MATPDRVGRWALSGVLTRPGVLRLVNIRCFRSPTRPVTRPEAYWASGGGKSKILDFWFANLSGPLPKLKLGGWSSFCVGGLFQSLITSGAAPEKEETGREQLALLLI